MTPLPERRRRTEGPRGRIATLGAFLAATVFLMTALLMALPAAAESRPLCTCRYAGQSFAQGACVCIMTPRGPRRACCEKVLNNSSWSFKTGLCPLVRAPAPRQGDAETTAPPVPEVAQTPPEF